MITSFIDWLVNIIETLGYPGVALSMFVESFFAPIPSEIILPFSGFVASGGSLNIWVVIIVATVAAYLGSLPFYIVGLLGEEKIQIFLEKYGKYLFISQKDLDTGYRVFERLGIGIVFLGRLVPIVRTVISFPAGVAKMNFPIFSIFTLLGTFIWSTILAYAGFVLGDNWSVVSEYISEYEHIILIVLVVGFVAYVARGVWSMSTRSDK